MFVLSYCLGKDLYQWLQTFENLFVVSSSETRDDMLFYVKYDSKNVRQKYICLSIDTIISMVRAGVIIILCLQKKEVIEVQRKDAKSLPELVHIILS